MFCLSAMPSGRAMMRAMVSVVLPGPNGTTIVIGRDGYVCAPAIGEAAARAAPIAARIRTRLAARDRTRGGRFIMFHPSWADARRVSRMPKLAQARLSIVNANIQGGSNCRKEGRTQRGLVGRR